MSLSPYNYKSSLIRGLCRTCLAKEIKLVPVFELRFGKITFDRVISAITGIKIKQDDGLPTTICKDCEQKAAKAYDFKVNALQSEDKLYKILQETQEISNEEDFTIEVDQKNVKMEHETPDCDDNDDLDLDLSLPFDDAEDSFEVDTMIKNEPDVKCEINNPKENLKSEVFFEEEMEKNSSYCPVCCQSFPDVESLTSHAWQQHADVMGPKKRGRKKKLTSMILHKMTENGNDSKQETDQQYKCLFCGSTFKTKDVLTLHTPEHKDEKLYSCMLCKKIYWKKKDFERHTCTKQLDLNNKGERPLDSQPDEKHELYTEVRLRDLMKKNEGQQFDVISTCDCCGSLFVSAADLENHRDRDHPEISVKCHICHKVFATLKSAARHRAACEQVERRFSCPTCALRFSHEVTLNKHILRVHAGQSVSLRFLDRGREPSSQNYKCETCSRPFSRKDLLERHVRSHNTGEKVFECDICKKKFTRRDNLRSHLRTHEGKKYTEGAGSLCLYCGRSFTNSSNYIVHMRRHTGEKPYKCDFCGKGFCRSSDLQCHRRLHTGEKPCVCRVCGKAFSRSSKLTRHMRVHTGDKPYKCTYCEKAFAQSNDLTVHVRRHTGDKPYVCELCGDRFIQGTALHAHRRTHGHYPTTAAPQPPPVSYTLQNTTQAQCPAQN